MARYTGPKTKKARSFGEAIYGVDKYFERRKFPPGQHGQSRKRKQRSDYAVQLAEKQKAKYIYGVLERQFRATFERATAKHGVTGEWLLKLLEARLDNVVYRLGLARTRSGARQLVSHKHILVNGILSNSPSHQLRPGDVLMACSDGVWHYFSPNELGSVLSSLSPREATEFLIDKARSRGRGGGDNLSLVIVKLEPLDSL